MEQRRTRKQKIEFSKVISIVMLTIFVFTFFVAWFTYITQDKVSTELLSFVSTPLMVVISGYFTKATFENVNKIKENN